MHGYGTPNGKRTDAAAYSFPQPKANSKAVCTLGADTNLTGFLTVLMPRRVK